MSTFEDDCNAVARTTPIDVTAVDALVERFYAMPNNGAGGSLHNVLDDTNLEDDSIDWCIAHAGSVGDAAGVALGLLRAMTLAERLGMADVCQCGCAADLRAEAGLPPVGGYPQVVRW